MAAGLFPLVLKRRAGGWNIIPSLPSSRTYTPPAYTTEIPLQKMQHHRVGINPILTSSPSGTPYFRPVPTQWDIRHPPRRTAHIAELEKLISSRQLTQLATFPAVPTIHVISDLLSEEWVVTADNPTGVTVEDILTSIYQELRVPITQAEWSRMSPRQQFLIQDTFYARCEASREFERTRNAGVLRVDCLHNTTTFAGLSSLMYRNNRWEVVLTLSRDFRARASSRRRDV